VQGRKPEKWRNWVGMAQAATILIESAEGGVKVSIGGAEWIDKAAVAATGLFLTMGITWITSVVGIYQQQNFVDGLWQVAESYAKMRGGRQAAFG